MFLGVIFNLCVGEIDYFSGNKETLDIIQFKKRLLLERSFFCLVEIYKIHI